MLPTHDFESAPRFAPPAEGCSPAATSRTPRTRRARVQKPGQSRRWWPPASTRSSRCSPCATATPSGHVAEGVASAYESSQLVTLRSTPLGQKECGRPSHWTSCFRTRSALNTSASSNNEDGENMIHKRMSIAIGSAALLAFIAPACSSDSKNNSSTTVAGAPAVSRRRYDSDTTAAGGSAAASWLRTDDLGQ